MTGSESSAERLRALEAENDELRRRLAVLEHSEDEMREGSDVLPGNLGTLPMMITIIGRDGRIEAVNNEWERTLGWTVEDLASEDLHDDCKTQTRDGRPIETAWIRFRLSDGRHVEIGHEISYGAPTGQMVPVLDETLRQVAETMGKVFWILDSRSERYLYVSPAYERVWGLSPESLYANSHSAIETVYVEDRHRVAAARDIQLRLHTVTELEYRIIRPDGEVRWISERSISVRIGSGEIGRIAGMAEDVTERKRADEALHRTQAYLEEAERLSHIGSWAYSAKAREIVFWSEEHFRIFGFDPADGIPPLAAAVGRVHTDDEAPFSGFERAVAEERDYEFEFRIVVPDGSIKHILSIGHPHRSESGELLEFTGVAMDITERKKVESKLHRSFSQLRALATQLERVREEEGRRIARELHDELGSSLTSLKWDLEELENPLASTDLLDVAASRARITRMAALVDDTIHAVKRISSELRPAILDDLGILDAVEWQCKQFKARTGIPCRYEGVSESRRMKREQSTVVFRIVQEALTNIIRHAHATSVEIAIEESGDEFILTISDDGRGIDDEQMKRPLSLGILGMHERARLVGGRVEIGGAAGKGTTVAVYIPLSDPMSVQGDIEE